MKLSFFEEQTRALSPKQKFLLFITYYFAKFLPKLSALFALKYLCNPHSRRHYTFKTTRSPSVHIVQTLMGQIKLFEFNPESELTTNSNLKHPSILLAHGWADTSTRFTQLINYLLEQNYTVWSLDHIGHGKSDGSISHLFGFIDGINNSIKYITETKQNQLDSILAHSMAGIAILNLNEEILLSRKIIIMSAPTLFFENMFRRIKSFGISALMLKNLFEYISKKFKYSWMDMYPSKHVDKINMNFLFIHDEDDKICSYDNIKDLIKDRPHRFYSTHGLGHLRILKDEKVLSKIDDFISSAI